METIETTVKEGMKFVCDYLPHDNLKKYTINGVNRAIFLFDNKLDLFASKLDHTITNVFYHTFSIPHEHLPTPYEVRK